LILKCTADVKNMYIASHKTSTGKSAVSLGTYESRQPDPITILISELW